MQPNKPPPKPDDKAWSGRFSEPVAELVKRYTASVGFDQRLAEYDIQGSLAHARGPDPSEEHVPELPFLGEHESDAAGAVARANG